MRIAIPVVNRQLARHFGHCDEFVLFDVDTDARSVGTSETVQAPPHQPGLLPQWLKELGVEVIIAGGMGRRAQALFAQSGVEVVVGAQDADPQAIVGAYLSGALRTGDNLCDH